MLNIPILKQDFMISRKTLLVFYCLQTASILIAAVIRNMRLIQISDMFWDTLPVVIFPMLMSMVLAMEAVQKRDADKTMTFILSTGISPGQIIMTKAVFVGLCVFVLMAFSMLLGSVLCVYDLTGVWNRSTYIVLNLGAMCLQLCVAGWCFFISCAGRKPSLLRYYGLGIGLPLLLYVMYLLQDFVPQLSVLQYVTVFSLFQQEMFASPGIFAFLASLVLAVAGLVFFGLGRYVFCTRSERD